VTALGRFLRGLVRAARDYEPNVYYPHGSRALELEASLKKDVIDANARTTSVATDVLKLVMDDRRRLDALERAVLRVERCAGTCGSAVFVDGRGVRRVSFRADGGGNATGYACATCWHAHRKLFTLEDDADKLRGVQ